MLFRSYSVEDGTPSAELPDRVPSRTKRARRARLMKLQQQVSLERNRRWIGREMEVLVETSDERRTTNDERKDTNGARWLTDDRAGAYVQSRNRAISKSPSHSSTLTPTPSIGRSFRDAPEIDGQVYLAAGDVRPGDFIKARIIEARPYDLIGEVESEKG